MATRTTKTIAPAVEPDDDAPSFTAATPEKVVYDGPVLFRIDGRAFRMRSGRTFASSLVFLNAVRRGMTVRTAEFTAIEDLAGPEALDALLKADLDAAAWGQVVRRAYDHLLGKDREDDGGN